MGAGWGLRLPRAPLSPFHILRRAEGPIAEGPEGWGATRHPCGLEVHIRSVLETSRLSSLHDEVKQSSRLKPGFSDSAAQLRPSSPRGTSAVPGIRCPPSPPWPGTLGLPTLRRASGPQHAGRVGSTHVCERGRGRLAGPALKPGPRKVSTQTGLPSVRGGPRVPGSRGALADPEAAESPAREQSPEQAQEGSRAAEPPETGRERALRVRRSLRGGARQRPGSRPWSFPSSHGGAGGRGDGRELPAAPRAGARLELRSRDAIERSPHCHRHLPLISDVQAWNAPPGSIGGRPDCPPLPADPGQGLSVRLETRGDELPSHEPRPQPRAPGRPLATPGRSPAATQPCPGRWDTEPRQAAETDSQQEITHDS